MGCGAKQFKTILAVGDIPADTIIPLAERENVRVLHLLTSAGDPVMPENDNYRMITGETDNRIFIMALLLQYDFPLILCREELLSQEFFTVCREQWHGEYARRSLLIYQENGQICETGFTKEELPAELQPRIDTAPLFNMLLS